MATVGYSEQVSHRPGLVNLQWADAHDTRQFLATLAYDDRELFRKCLNGCHITQDCKVHGQDGGSDLRPYCSCTDSRYHRFWERERSAGERPGVPMDVFDVVVTAPEFLTCYGWSVSPHTYLAWYRYLGDLPVPEVRSLRIEAEVMHVFSDGSCLNQAFPSCRLAAWAVVLGAWDPTHASGHLPGVLHGAYRAEIYVLYSALIALRLCVTPIRLWTDCGEVVRKFQRILQGHMPKPNSAHASLWPLVAQALNDIGTTDVVITKVAAHRALSSACSPLEEWCFAHISIRSCCQ